MMTSLKVGHLFITLMITSMTESQSWSNEFKIRIKGPKSVYDKIGIVGAGPSGIHMATLLKQKGFEDITILEKSNRLAGKSFTLNYRGAPQEMGTVYVSVDYEENIIQLIRTYNNDTLVPGQSASYWSDLTPGPINLITWLVERSKLKFKTNNATLARVKFFSDLGRYIALHRELFGTYEGELMPRPSKEVLHRIRGTFTEFLVRNNLDSLIPIFTASQTIQGYGYLDEVAALYGLIWNTPKLLSNIAKRDIIFVLKNGFQHLWETIAEKEKLSVRYNWPVTKVIRYRDGTHLCSYFHRCERFDFVVWTPHLDLALEQGIFSPALYEEKMIFSRLTPVYFTTSIINSLGYKRGMSATEHWVRNVATKKDHVYWASRDSYSIINEYQGVLYQNNLFPTGNDNKSIQTKVAYQYGLSKPTIPQLNKILKTAFFKNGATKVDILRTDVWRYFPRFSPEDSERGILWDILNIQGKYGMWYAGASVIFDSVKSVVEYNKLLVRLMEPVKHTFMDRHWFETHPYEELYDEGLVS